jgi:hypothetical protein
LSGQITGIEWNIEQNAKLKWEGDEMRRETNGKVEVELDLATDRRIPVLMSPAVAYSEIFSLGGGKVYRVTFHLAPFTHICAIQVVVINIPAVPEHLLLPVTDAALSRRYWPTPVDTNKNNAVISLILLDLVSFRMMRS